MINSIHWYFEASEKAKLAHDENGNYVCAYIAYGFEFEDPVDEKEFSTTYEQQVDEVKKVVSDQLQIPEEWLKSITEEAYKKIMEENLLT